MKNNVYNFIHLGLIFFLTLLLSSCSEPIVDHDTVFGEKQLSLDEQANLFNEYGIGPSVTLSSESSLITNSSFLVNVTFSKPIKNLSTNDFTLINGDITSLIGDEKDYVLTITPSLVGTVTLTLLPNSVEDEYGLTNPSGDTLFRVFDNQGPKPIISTLAPDPVSSDFDITITFSEDIQGFNPLSDLQVTRGNVASFTETTPNRVFNITLSPTSSGLMTIILPSGALTDLASNGNIESNLLTKVVDIDGPTIDSLTSPDAVSVNSAFRVDAIFSEPLSSFTTANITLSGTASASVTSITATSDRSYQFIVTPSATPEFGDITVTIATAAVSDLAGNPSINSLALTKSYDSRGPTTTITAITPYSSTNIIEPFTVQVSFAAPVNGLNTDADVTTVTNGSVSSLTMTDSTRQNYSFVVSPTGTPVTIQLDVGVGIDDNGNSSQASNTLTFNYDSTPPQMTIRALASDIVSGPFSVEMVSSDALDITDTDFGDLVVSDFTVSNATLSDLTGDGTTYYATLTPTNAGEVSLALEKYRYRNLSTFANTDSNTLTLTYAPERVDRDEHSSFVSANFSHAGLSERPEFTNTVTIPANSNSAAIQSAIDTAMSGTIIQLQSGSYTIDEPITIDKDNIIIRGAGSGETTLNVTYYHTTDFTNATPTPLKKTPSGTTIYFDTPLEVHSNNWGQYQVQTGTGQIIHRLDENQDRVTDSAAGPRLQVLSSVLSGEEIINNVGTGPQTIQIYSFGQLGSPYTIHNMGYTINDSLNPMKSDKQRRYPLKRAVFNIHGDHVTGQHSSQNWTWNLHQSADRGDLEIFLRHPTATNLSTILSPNDTIIIEGEFSSTLEALYSDGDDQEKTTQSQYLIVDSLSAALASELTLGVPSGQSVTKVTLKRPLKLNYPSNDPLNPIISRVKAHFWPIKNVGIEHLKIVQGGLVYLSNGYRQVPLHSIEMKAAQNCWIQGVHLETPTNNPLQLNGLDLEVANLEIHKPLWVSNAGSLNYADQATGLIYLDGVQDSLFHNILGLNMREAFRFTNSSNGNVIRESYFDSGVNFMSNLIHENLFENNYIISREEQRLSDHAFTLGSQFRIGQPAIRFSNPKWRNATLDNRYGTASGGPRNIFYKNTIESNNYPAFIFDGYAHDTTVAYNKITQGKNESVFLFRPHNFGHNILRNRIITNNDLSSNFLILLLEENGSIASDTDMNGIDFNTNEIYREAMNIISNIPPSTAITHASNTFNGLDFNLSAPSSSHDSLFSYHANKLQTQITSPLSTDTISVGDTITLSLDMNGPKGATQASPVSYTIEWFLGSKSIGTGNNINYIVNESGLKLLSAKVTLPNLDVSYAESLLLSIKSQDSSLESLGLEDALLAHFTIDDSYFDYDLNNHIQVWTDLKSGLKAYHLDNSLNQGSNLILATVDSREGLQFNDTNTYRLFLDLENFNFDQHQVGDQRTYVIVQRNNILADVGLFELNFGVPSTNVFLYTSNATLMGMGVGLDNENINTSLDPLNANVLTYKYDSTLAEAVMCANTYVGCGAPTFYDFSLNPQQVLDIKIGPAVTSGSNAYIYEVLIFNRELDDNEVDDVQTLLSTKFSL